MKSVYKAVAMSTALFAGATSAFAEYTLNVIFPTSFTEWIFATPMISFDGGKTGKAMSATPDKCGWFKYSFESINDISDNVVFYHSNDLDREDMVGLNGNWESGASFTPIPLTKIFKEFDKNELFFVSDKDLLLVSTDDGWYQNYPDVEGFCKYNLPMESYTATAQNIEDLKACGIDCLTDDSKFAAAIGSTNSASCGEGTFNRTTDNNWNYSTEKHENTCTSFRTIFTMHPGQSLQISGASLVWALVDGQPATLQNGANGSSVLDLDSYKDLANQFLVESRNYTLQVFYCDQESTSPFINIQFNLDMASSLSNKAITSRATKDKKDKSISRYEICYAAIAPNSCAPLYASDDNIEICGEDFAKEEAKDLTVSYYLVQGIYFNKKIAKPLETGKIHYGGIDLTNPYQPAINKKTISLNPGRWTLFVEIDDGSNTLQKKIASFLVAGEIAIMPESSVATWFDEDDTVINNIPYQFVGEGIVGTLIPLYVSAIVQYSPTLMQPSDAVGTSYRIDTDQPSVMILAAGKDSTYDVIGSGIERTIGKSGVDTLYAYIDSATFAKEHQGKTSLEAKIFVNGASDKAATIQFKLGELANKPNIVLAIKELQAKAAQSSYTIYDLKGKVVKRGIATPGSTIPAPGQGTYIIRTNGKSKVVKFK